MKNMDWNETQNPQKNNVWARLIFIAYDKVA